MEKIRKLKNNQSLGDKETNSKVEGVLENKEILNELGEVNSFLDKIFLSLENDGIDMAKNELDHICYRVKTKEKYEYLKNILESHGELLSEKIINGRPIANYKLKKPINYNDRVINCVELPFPKEGFDYDEGYEHVEFVIDENLESFMEKHKTVKFNTKDLNLKVNPAIVINYDGFAVKFHNNSIEYVIKYLD